MKTLNELTVGTKLESVEYFKGNAKKSTELENVEVVASTSLEILVKTEEDSFKIIRPNKVVDYVVAQRVITVSYKKAEDEKEKTYPNWVVAKETETHILITKEINGKNLYRNLIKEKIKELKEMN